MADDSALKQAQAVAERAEEELKRAAQAASDAHTQVSIEADKLAKEEQVEATNSSSRRNNGWGGIL